jgi:hypothetical protein
MAEVEITFPELRDACGVAQAAFADFLKKDPAAKRLFNHLRVDQGVADDASRAVVLRLMVGDELFRFGLAMVTQRKQETSTDDQQV